MDLAKYIDHTLLKPSATVRDIERLCAEAVEFGFYSVCLNSFFVKTAEAALKSSNVKVCSVIGFPLGSTRAAIKVAEAQQAIFDGAQELDMVINLGMAKAGFWDYVQDDIAAVVEAAAKNALVKVIIECCLLTRGEKKLACLAAKGAGADFVKTSTGFSAGGATTEDVQLMRQTVGETLGVKASGGIRTREDALRMIQAGATRIGTSNGIELIKQ